mmetsp:Transcript_1840/g.1918  ORF Transcript_1840/g.1918 Transcript_1840/m.1918 type:complete len:323 (-) Transcript_1840:68-1036(-)|eukprot:CAMPEP_0182429182 /NCGR_PEP_ID=MMETSP1167-20130531/25576_1 /TAXON_ID=2988 /ORGANISM="Mallomonas Sp, Strain CCMP3275" /LENGTH=322 /DNA_ID=CAMNT_0024612551 /DNA_START=28 /DNA_END=996 /DNA_ORIENTATION=-
MKLFTFFIISATASRAVNVVEMDVGMEGMPVEAYADICSACKNELYELIDRTNANPIFVRLAWHDSGTFDANSSQPWPKKGGANGSIRFMPEIGHGANAGLDKAIALLAPLKAKYPPISWADLMQMASAVSVEHAGGPKIDMIYGRMDVKSPEDCAVEGNLPDGNAPFHDGASTPGAHLRNIFHRMGLSDQDIVALSGAHTLGRAHKTRSGAGEEITKYTSEDVVARKDGVAGIGSTIGGSAWTKNWLTFDNSYFTTIKDTQSDPELLKLQTDRAIFEDEKFSLYAEKYASDQDTFFVDYAAAHKRLSELGSQFIIPGGIKI